MGTELGFPATAPPLLSCPVAPLPASPCPQPLRDRVLWASVGSGHPLFWDGWDGCLVVKLGSPKDIRALGWGWGDGQAQGPLVSRTAPSLETSPPSGRRCVQGSPALCLHAHLLLTNFLADVGWVPYGDPQAYPSHSGGHLPAVPPALALVPGEDEALTLGPVCPPGLFSPPGPRRGGASAQSPPPSHSVAGRGCTGVTPGLTPSACPSWLPLPVASRFLVWHAHWQLGPLCKLWTPVSWP